MRKLLCMLLCLVMVLGLLSACGSTAAASTDSAAADTAAADTADNQADAADDAEEAEEAEDASEVEEEDAGPAHVLPLTEDEVTFTMFEGMNPNLMSYIETYAETTVFQYLKEVTGVNVEVPAVHPASQTEDFQLMVASGDYTDFIGNMTNYTGGVEAALEDEVIVALSDYEEYMPLFFDAIEKYDDAARDCRLDSGAVAMTYMIYDGDYEVYTNGYCMRSDWLEELGMDAPHTYDEYYEVLTAFKNNYGATMWFSGSGSPNLTRGYGILAGYGFGFSSSLDCFYQEDGVVKCGFLEDSFEDYLRMMNKWYSEGLIYQDYFTNGTGYASGSSDALADVVNGKIGLWVEEGQSFSAYDGYDIEFIGTSMPVQNEGDQLHLANGVTRVNQPKYAVSTNCDDVELACEWLDMWYSPEVTVVANWGIEGESFEYDENGKPVYTDLINNNPDGMTVSLARDRYTAPTGGYFIDPLKDTIIWGDAQYAAAEAWGRDVDDSGIISSYITKTTEEGEEFNRLQSDLITYASTELCKLINGEKSIDNDLDTFIQTLKDMGIERCVEINQAALDRYYER